MRIRISLSTVAGRMYHRGFIPPQRGSPMSAQASGLGKGPTKCVEPQPGRPETIVGILAARVRFVGVHDVRLTRFPFIGAASVWAMLIGLRSDPGRWPGMGASLWD